MSDLRPIHTDPALHLVLERTTHVPVELVWRAWTEPELLKRWFCPSPWYVSAAELEIYPGGAFNVVRSSPEGEHFPSEGCVLEVVDNRRLVYTSALLRGFRPQPPSAHAHPAFLLTVALDIEPIEGGTRYKALAVHTDSESRAAHLEMGFDEGWGAVFEQLVELMSSPEFR